MTPYADAWTARGGHFVGSREARALSHLEREYGAAETLRRWCVMLDRVSELRFASAALLLRSWGDYAADAPLARGGHVHEEPEVIAARLKATMRAAYGEGGDHARGA